jgi:hypothetical protein
LFPDGVKKRERERERGGRGKRGSPFSFSFSLLFGFGPTCARAVAGRWPGGRDADGRREITSTVRVESPGAGARAAREGAAHTERERREREERGQKTLLVLAFLLDA